MPDFYSWVILLDNQSEEIGEKQLSVLGSRGGQICPFVVGTVVVFVFNVPPTAKVIWRRDFVVCTIGGRYVESDS